MAKEKGKAAEQKQPAAANQEKRYPFVKTEAGQAANRMIARQYADGWAHVRAGKKVAWMMYAPPREILKAFDVLDIYPEAYAATCAIMQKTEPYIEYAEGEGFSEYICGYLRHAMGYALALARGDSLDIAPLGGMPKPSMLISGSRICDPRTKVFETIRRYLDVPAYIYDHQIPPGEDPRILDEKIHEHYIAHNEDEFRGLVKFLEEQTGTKLDVQKLSHLVQNSLDAWQLFHKSFELRKNRPCPMPWEDLMVVWRPFRDMAGDDAALQFYKDTYEEMRERVRLGISVAKPKEKYRLMWLGLPMWFDVPLLDYMEERGAVVVTDAMYHATKPREIKLGKDPIRTIAEKEYWSWDIYGGSDGTQPKCGLINGSHILELARDYKVDGVIEHTVISCRACTLGGRHIGKVLREDKGIPVLEIESHMTNLSAYSPTATRERVDAFINIMEEKKR